MVFERLPKGSTGTSIFPSTFEPLNQIQKKASKPNNCTAVWDTSNFNWLQNKHCHWHFGFNKLLLLTKKSLMKRCQKIWVGPNPPHLNKIQKNSSFFQEQLPNLFWGFSSLQLWKFFWNSKSKAPFAFSPASPLFQLLPPRAESDNFAKSHFNYSRSKHNFICVNDKIQDFAS